MTLFRAIEPAGAVAFEGEASNASLWEAAREAALLADNFNARDNALSEAIDDAIGVVRTETGIELRNPQSHPGDYSGDTPVVLTGEHFGAAWDRRIADIIEQHPEKADRLQGLRLESLEVDARNRARIAGDRYAILAATREDWTGLGVGLGGGFSGALQDPATLIALPLGLGAGSARTVGGKILATTWREALVSGAAETAIQPFVQKWRSEAGLPAGLTEGARNVAAAALLGGLIGGGVRGAIETPGVVRRRFSSRPDPRLPAADPEKIASDLKTVRDDLPPATRAAVDVLEDEQLFRGAVRSELGGDIGADMVRVMEAADEFAHTVGQSAQARFRPEPAPARTVRRPVSLTEFLAERGIADEGGELAAMDLDRLAVPGSGRLVRKQGGVPLDRAREAAAEAGYLQGYGSRADAVANSRVDDLLSALREEQAGRRVFAMGDEEQALRWREEGEAIEAHKAIQDIRREIFEASGGRLNADETARAQRLVEGGMDPDEAVERVVFYEDTAALEARADPFEPDSTEFEAQVTGLENQIDPEDGIADLLFVDDDGRISSSGRTVAEALEEADRGLHLSELVEACRPA